MRVACVYAPRLHSGCGKFHFIAQAFRNVGADVVHVVNGEQLFRADESCDLVLFEQRQPAEVDDVLIPKIARNKRAIWAQWFFDLNVFDDSLPIEKQAPVEPFLPIMRAMDIVYVKERPRLQEYRAAGIPAQWLDQACPSNMRQIPISRDTEFDIMLWGSTGPLWRTRWQDAEILAANGFRVAWATSRGQVPTNVTRLVDVQPLDLPGLMEQAKITLVVDARQDIDGYWSDRIWLAAGAGACILRRVTIGCPGIGFGYLAHPRMLSLATELVQDYELRCRVARDAREQTVQNGTYEHRAAEIIRHVDHFKRLQQTGQNQTDLPDLSRNREAAGCAKS